MRLNQLYQQLQSWRRRHPRKFWVAGLMTVVVAAGAGFLIYARNATVTRALNYGPCEISYGQSVSAWDGTVEQTWNDRNYHYEVRRFLIKSTAPASIWANVKELTPATISAQTCRPDFQPVVDAAADQYRWQGARAVAIRLGQPDLNDVNNNGRVEVPPNRTRADPRFSPPLYTDDYQQAAAWVDDAANAAIQSGAQPPQTVWCHPVSNSNQAPASCAANEGLIAAGYLFTDDNCPLAGGIDCNRVADWYRAGSQDFDLTKIVGVNSRGELSNFNLHLTATSTHGYEVGTWIDLTFKYARLSEVGNQLQLAKTTVKTGEEIQVALNLTKTGPHLEQLLIQPDITGQPIEITQNFQLTPELLTKLNQSGEVQLTGSFKVKDNPPAGECFNLTVNFQAASVVERDANRQVAVPALAQRYCIALPPATARYTYDVQTRGAVQSDFGQFQALAIETLASRLGWTQAGVSFAQVASGGNFTLVLANPDQMTSFSSGCDSIYSCQAGRFVIINDERWRTATPSWNNSGGSLRDYRHMVINHEVGHWLGFGHLTCPAAGAPAPVMQQQSISLQGCLHNPWPTPAEITKLKA